MICWICAFLDYLDPMHYFYIWTILPLSGDTLGNSQVAMTHGGLLWVLLFLAHRLQLINQTKQNNGNEYFTRQSSLQKNKEPLQASVYQDANNKPLWKPCVACIDKMHQWNELRYNIKNLETITSLENKRLQCMHLVPYTSTAWHLAMGTSCMEAADR